MFIYFICALIGYLLGSLNFGILISKLLFNKDVRNYGSKNAGMTNTARTFGKKAGAMVFTGDCLKSVAACLIAVKLSKFGTDTVLCGYIAGLFTVIGHIFPVYFKFKGGKGVATALGVTAAMSPVAAPVVLIPFIITLAISKMVSLSSIIAVASAPVITFIIYRYLPFINPSSYNHSALIPTVIISVIAVIIILKHISNIKRIINGNENKIK